ncbi:hypothetical protein PsYK624_171160 [Phanerochaete sordida]|uniref:Uncharacterized protein n=1 Tax=Phanerochaete sordida TaxID=48140 RepID=A0A9P3GUQ8_9APHY|nr:hypothetical protein PsYK624_171160 [Phanerochaete sordida]
MLEATKRKKTPEDEDEDSGQEPAASDLEARTFTYTIRILSAAELQKSVKKQQPVSKQFELESTDVFDTFKAQLLVQICNALNPAKINFGDYDIAFTVPRHVTDPMDLRDENDYAIMVKNVDKITKNPSAKLMVKQRSVPAPDRVNGKAPRKKSRTANGVDALLNGLVEITISE